MNKRTLKALKGSIDKWWNIAYEDSRDLGVNNCPLCDLFYFENYYEETTTLGPCLNCPVCIKTGKRFCADTPYLAYAFNDIQKNAIEEMEFLISLLPKDETWTSPDGKWIYYNEC